MKQVLETCGGTRIQVQPPWPPLPTAQSSPPISDTQALNVQRSTFNVQSSTPISNGAAAPRTWLYSGNLGRAHEYKDLLEAQRLLEASGAPWQLVFQGSGPCRNEAKALASQLGLKNCLWQPYAPSDQLLPSLLAADVLIASQKESLQGLLWPSKLALMTLTARPILWLGPTQGQIATDLATASPLNGLFSPGHPEAIAHWLSSLPPKDSANLPTQESIQSRANHLRIQGLNLWANHLLHSPK
jgi:hypothetical protein